MTLAEFTKLTETALINLNKEMHPFHARNSREMNAMIQLNTELKQVDPDRTEMILDILKMRDGPEKLRASILWTIAASNTPPDTFREIVNAFDVYVKKAAEIDS